ncbi:2Fe-2S iron-sulfur cluster-binding protein [Hydrocarboniphaga sp.]|uniref:2Fe-2S iron-sulfur cluster-binding protein n=1 Tax=Hydrocarboniphaga sp. TaxID=2033016 RepID=UPI003D0AE33C
MLSRLFQRSSSDHVLEIAPSGKILKTNAKTTILQAALDQAIAFPHNCRVGGCATCKCKLLSGRVREMTDKSYVLSAAELKQGYILACQSVALTDVRIEVDIATRSAHPVVHTSGVITALEPMTHDILRVECRLKDAAAYTAGQFAEVYVKGVGAGDSRESRNYSFSAAPGVRDKVDTVEFFIRHVPGGAFTDWLFKHAKLGDEIEGHGPYGDFWLRPGTAPIVAVAGGSGLAPVIAMLEQARAERITRDVTLFFGARSQRDLYCLSRIEQLSNQWMARFEFVPVLSDEPANSGWTGLRGFIPQHFASVVGARLAEHHAYLCGPPPMIDACLKVFTDSGIAAENTHFDKFLDRSHVVAM